MVIISSLTASLFSSLIETGTAMPALSSRIEDLKQRLDDNEGVVTISMAEVRDACGFERLRKHVVASISEKLELAGIGHVPRRLPMDQSKKVRLYLRTSRAGGLIDAALKPGTKNDDKLRELAAGAAQAKLESIREILSR
jgi:hypothetical protein